MKSFENFALLLLHHIRELATAIMQQYAGIFNNIYKININIICKGQTCDTFHKYNIKSETAEWWPFYFKSPNKLHDS